MWPTVLTSALLGAGVALVTSEPHGLASHLSAAPPQRSLQGVTCQMRPDMRLVSPEPCQGGAATVEPCAYHGFMSLSADLNTCDLIGADALDSGLQFTPYCNDTQMTACAEATGSFWRQQGSNHFSKDLEVPAASIIQVLVAPLVNLRLGSEGGYQGLLLPPVPPPRTNFEEHESSTASPREVPQTAANSLPARDNGAVNAQPMIDVIMDDEGREVEAPSPKPISPILDMTARSSEKPGISNPTWSGNKQLAGMAAALTTVLFIFVVWL